MGNLLIRVNGFKTLKVIKAYSLTLFIICIFSASIACSSSKTNLTPSSDLPANFTTYTDKKYSYSISYPDTWETPYNMEQVIANAKDNLKSENQSKTPEFLFAKTYKYDGKTAGLTITTLTVTADVNTVGQAIDGAIMGMKQIDPNFKELSEKVTWVGGEVAGIVEYQTHMTPNGTLYHAQSLCAVVDNKIWIVACSTTDDNYAQLSSDFNNILKSFKLNY
jgi:hypothetical protein